MIEPKYKVEMFPMYKRNMPGGGTITNLSPIQGRVLENYRGSHVGSFTLNSDGKVIIYLWLKGWKEHKILEDPQRLDVVVEEIWKEYSKKLSFKDKAWRCLYSHRSWIASFITAVIAAAIATGTVELLSSLASK